MPIELISKEVINKPIVWPVVVALCVFISALIILMIIMAVKKNVSMNKIIKGLSWIAGIGLSTVFGLMLITGIFFRVPTEDYRYTVMVNRDVMTLNEYDNFRHTYNPLQGTNPNTFVFTSSADLDEDSINDSIK